MTGSERLLAACHGVPVDATPVWFMRQAGGSLPRYQALRERHTVMEIAKTPSLCAEVTVGAAEVLETDGAVLFADVMLPVEAMGVAVTLTSDGPIIDRPIRSALDLARLRTVDAATDLGFVAEAIRLARSALDGRAALIGIAGGPFTIAAYLIEGRPSRDQAIARRLALLEPALWSALLDRITSTTIDYVTAQVAAGAQVVQVFDSWAGSLSAADYDTMVAPWSRRILTAIQAAGVPAIHFAAFGANVLERLAAGADVVGVDATLSFAAARARLGTVPVQGNLDATRLLGDWAMVQAGVDEVLAANDGRPGHIFNTGHAIARDTDPIRMRDVVRSVHDRTSTTVRRQERPHD